MNDIQKKLLEIAIEYIKVCDQLNLRYFAIGGTCLGAIRHNGFIPWDDDMDFGMPRKDYETFLKKAPLLLPNYLFVQTHESDKHYYYPFMKIRDSRTTAVEYELKNFKINHGLWIDIFPMDGLPEEKKDRSKMIFRSKQIFRRRYLSFYYTSKYWLSILKKIFVYFIFPLKSTAYYAEQREIQKYDFDNSKHFWFTWSNCLLHNYETNWFSKYLLIRFENILIRVPFKFEDYLRDEYGDWKTLPPIDKRNSGHEFYILNIEESFKKIDIYIK